jgi:hypothetical protein
MCFFKWGSNNSKLAGTPVIRQSQLGHFSGGHPVPWKYLKHFSGIEDDDGNFRFFSAEVLAKIILKFLS